MAVTYPHPFLRLVAAGTLPGPEAWSWSLSLSPNFPDATDPAPATVPAAVVTAVQTFHAATGITNAATRLTTIKLNRIGVDGHYMNETNTVQHDFATPGIAGAYSGAAMPNQVALAVTLRTRNRRGLAKVGRFYVPTPAAFPDVATGLISAAAAGTVAAAATAMLNALNAALPGYRVAVMSGVRSGASEDVTHVTVGRALDTIRSRRSNVAEQPVVGATLTP